MPAQIKILTHQGREIALFDCTGQKPENIAVMLPELARTMISRKINLLINDISNTTTDEKIKQAAMRCSTEVSAALGVPVHAAFLGIRGVQKIIAGAVAKGNFFASGLDEAQAWLIKQ